MESASWTDTAGGLHPCWSRTLPAAPGHTPSGWSIWTEVTFTTSNLEETSKRQWNWTARVREHQRFCIEKFCGGIWKLTQSSHSQVTECRGSRPTFYHKSKDRRKFCGRTDTFSLPGFMVCCPQIHEVLQFPNASFTPQLSVFLAQHKRLLDSRLHTLLWQPFPQALRSGGHSLMVA